MWKLSAILPHAPGLTINGSVGQAKSPAARGRALHTLTTWIDEGRVNSKNGLFGKHVCVPVSHGEELFKICFEGPLHQKYLACFLKMTDTRILLQIYSRRNSSSVALESSLLTSSLMAVTHTEFRNHFHSCHIYFKPMVLIWNLGSG